MKLKLRVSLVEQELLVLLGHLSSPRFVVVVVVVAKSVVFCVWLCDVIVCICLFSVLQFTALDYVYIIFNLFFYKYAIS